MQLRFHLSKGHSDFMQISFHALLIYTKYPVELFPNSRLPRWFRFLIKGEPPNSPRLTDGKEKQILDSPQWRQRKQLRFLARQRRPIRFHAIAVYTTTNLYYGRPRKETKKKTIRFSKSDSAKEFGSWFGQGKSKQATHLPIFSSQPTKLTNYE